MSSEKWAEAHECCQKILNGGMIFKEPQVFVLLLKRNIMLNEILGKSNYSKEEIKRTFEEMKITNPLMEEWDLNHQD